MAKRFFYVCAGILMLALSYHFEAQSASAQAPGNPVVGTFGTIPAVVTANGDIYYDTSGGLTAAAWQRFGNVFTNVGPTPVQPTTFGALKAKFRN